MLARGRVLRLAVLAVVGATACQPVRRSASRRACRLARPGRRRGCRVEHPPARPAVANHRCPPPPPQTAPAAPALPLLRPRPRDARAARPRRHARPACPSPALGTLPADQRTARAPARLPSPPATTRAPSRSSSHSWTNRPRRAPARSAPALGQALRRRSTVRQRSVAADALIGATTTGPISTPLRAWPAARRCAAWNAGDDAATELRAVADANPLVGPAVRLELEDMWLLEAIGPTRPRWTASKDSTSPRRACSRSSSPKTWAKPRSRSATPTPPWTPIASC